MLEIVKDKLAIAYEWAQARWGERTSWDGAVIIAVSLLVIIAAPIIKLLAWPALAYGIYTLVKSELPSWD
jgi:hypothetical protein